MWCLFHIFKRRFHCLGKWKRDLKNYIYSDLIPAIMPRFFSPIDWSFAGSLVHSSVRWFFRSLVRSLVRSFVRSFISSLVRSFVRSFIHCFIRSSIPSGTCLFVRWLVFQCHCPVLINFHSTDVRVGFCFDKFDEDGCTNPKGREMRKSVCCCTMGAGWGDPCELCPQKNTCKWIALSECNFAS